MRSTFHFFTILTISLLVPVAVIGKSRTKRQQQTFDFSRNNGNPDTDWNVPVPAKTMTAPPPPDWNDNVVAGQNGNTPATTMRSTATEEAAPGIPTTPKSAAAEIPPPPNLPPEVPPPFPALPQDSPGPEHNVMCSPNICLYFLNYCPPHQECTMDVQCTNMLCISKTESRPTVPTPTTVQPILGPSSTGGVVGRGAQQNDSDTQTTEQQAVDCPGYKNLCFNNNGHCLSTQRCVMSDNCTYVICVERNISLTPLPLPRTTTSKSGFRDDCPRNLCVDYPAACPEDQECHMDLECKLIRCINKNFSLVQTTAAPHGVNEKADTSSIALRPFSERQCTSYFTCLHGYCNTKRRTCTCDKGWTGVKCNLPCNLDCVHGNCYITVTHPTYIAPKDVTARLLKCNCDPGWYKRLCDEKIPDLVSEAEKRTLKIGLSLGAVLLVVTASSIVVLIVLWRKRVIVVMKLVYFFKLEEDGDGRMYDAYISMGSSTQGMKFVMDQLCPMLEQAGFRLYVQARDQPIGEVVSNSILTVMEQSRRTILIITPDYLKNEWSRFECITAQIETLKLHQRIIPIILEDVSKDDQAMDKTLRHILDSVKCLKFPRLKDDPSIPLKEIEIMKDRREKKFWKRLELTMPKKPKKNRHFSSTSSETEITEVEIKSLNSIHTSFTEITEPKNINLNSTDASFTDTKTIDTTFTDMYSIV